MSLRHESDTALRLTFLVFGKTVDILLLGVLVLSDWGLEGLPASLGRRVQKI